ncbi:hypothetical protein [uncultured Faecalibaculum sp.]|uniref:hypothetical protein n=1 Tax=uncultured Faecalibaculum sp. TaxID=1729681 RepID=UPI002633AA8B|nr:hypothetical protein [uncultured Faecalibaculum sp.]
MKLWKWLLIAVAIAVATLIVFSLLWQKTGPVSDKPVSEQSLQQSQMIDDMDPFSEESKSQADMLEGTVDY